MLADLPIEFRHIFYLFCVVGPENEILRIETVREEVKETWDETNQQNSGKVTEEMVQGAISPDFLQTEFLLQNLEIDLWRADVASPFTPSNFSISYRQTKVSPSHQTGATYFSNK